MKELIQLIGGMMLVKAQYIPQGLSAFTWTLPIATIGWILILLISNRIK